MKIREIKLDKFQEVISKLRILRVRFECEDSWVLYPIIFTSIDRCGVLIGSHEVEKYKSNVGEMVLGKLELDGYEYIMDLRILGVSEGESSLLTLTINNVFKYRDLRNTFRVSTHIHSWVLDGTEEIKGVLKDISVGGALFNCRHNLELFDEIKLFFYIEGKQKVLVDAKIVKKIKLHDFEDYSYGFKFINLSKGNRNILKEFINDYEKAFEINTKHVVDHRLNNCKYVGSKTIILSYDFTEMDYLRNLLRIIGARNYDVVSNFDACKTAISVERPKLTFVDGVSSGIETTSAVIHLLSEEFEDLNIMLLIPYEYWGKHSELFGEYKNLTCLFYPLIDGELEESLLKYL